jgi:type 1 fimbria pilin
MKLATIIFLLVILPGMRFDSISPASGKEGDTLTIKGDNFGSGCEITLGRKVVEITGHTSSEFKIRAPRHSIGKKTLTIVCKDRMPIFERQVFEYTQ